MGQHESQSGTPAANQDERTIKPAGKPEKEKGPAPVTYQPESGQPGEREPARPEADRR